MAIEVVTDFRVLIKLASTLGRAEKGGNKEAIAKARAEHDTYRDLCLNADKMTLGMSHSAL